MLSRIFMHLGWFFVIFAVGSYLGESSNKPLQPTRAASLLGRQETPRSGPRG